MNIVNSVPAVEKSLMGKLHAIPQYLPTIAAAHLNVYVS